MPVRTRAREQPAGARRSVVPDAADRSPWLAAVWTGAGAAIVCAIVAIVAVAVCWLPAAGSSGHTVAAIRAGLLTFLGALHGGLTVDGVDTTWLPLGMLAIIGVTAWRAGAGLADATDTMNADDTARLVLVGLTQAASFTCCCLVAVPFATLGTSRAPFVGVAIGAFVLFALTGGLGYLRGSVLRARCARAVRPELMLIGRSAAAVVVVYAAAASLLVAGSLVVHHVEAERLSSSVGGGLSGVPLLLLGILAAPNAVIAAMSYLAGPGFAIGAGSTASLSATAHGTLPAFPILAAVPTGHGANAAVLVLVLAALTPLLAAVAVLRLAMRADGWPARFTVAGGSAVLAGLLMLALAWQGGGAAGDGRLHTIGASPWQLGGVVLLTTALLSAAGLGLAVAREVLTAHRAERRATALPRPTFNLLNTDEPDSRAGTDVDSEDELAG